MELPATVPPPPRGPTRSGLLDLVRYVRDPRGTLARFAATWGDPFLVPGAEGPTVFTGDPEVVRAVYAADPDGFDVPLKDDLATFFGPTALLLTSGARHRRDRKLLMPPFHGARLRAYGGVVVASARAAAARWTPGARLTMLDETQAITLEVILRAVFGVEDDDRRAAFRREVAALARAMSSPVIGMFEAARRPFGGFGPWARFLAARARFDALVHQELAVRRAEGPRDDILSLLLAARTEDGEALSDEELRDQLHLLLFAGHDTTSTALAWAFHELHRAPEILAELRAELATLPPDADPDAVAAQPLLGAVCKETLRIHPVVANVSGRLLREPLDVKGVRLPAGATVMVSSLMVHEREDVYPEPRRFRPHRFLERKFSPAEFVPFGGGSRRCIGAALATFEMSLALATLLPAHTLRLASERASKHVVRGLTMGPKNGVPMVVVS